MKNAIAEYRAAGWKLCRIPPGTKGPRDIGWNTVGKEIPEATEVPLGWGVGLLHATSGTCAFDIDDYAGTYDWMAERGIDLGALIAAPDARRIVSGRPGSAKLLYALPAPRASVHVKKGYKMLFELRCASGNGNSLQDVLPPSIHPRGTPYEWQGDTVDILGATVLPPLPAELEALWDELKAPATKAPPTPAAPPPPAPRQAELNRFLSACDPNGGFEDWLAVGMVLHHEYAGDLDGRAAWDQWSAKSHKYQGTHDLDAHWRTFRMDKPGRTLDGWLQKQPAAAGEFAPVAAPKAAEPEDYVLEPVIQGAHRAAYELLHQRVVFLADKDAWWIRRDPKAPHPELDRFANKPYKPSAFRTLLKKFMPSETRGKRGQFVMDPIETLMEARWRVDASGVGFDPSPGAGPLFTDPTDGCRYVNSYQKPIVEPEPMPAGMQERLEWLFNRVVDPTARHWIMWLFAYVLQNPGDRVIGAPLLVSANAGTGKSTLMLTLPQLLFAHKYVYEIPKEQIASDFATGNFASSWWVALEEIRAPGGRRDRQALTDKLKTWITQDRVSIRGLFTQAYPIRNFLQFTATSQHIDALHIDDGKDERRWCISEMKAAQLTADEKAYLNPLFGAPKVRDPRAAAWLQHYFLTKDLNRYSYKPNDAPPHTDARDKMAEASEDAWYARAKEMFLGCELPFHVDLVKPRDIAAQLRRGYQEPSPAECSEILRKLGGVQSRTDSDRFWIMRNHDQWAAASNTAKNLYLRSGVRPFVDTSELI